MLAGMLRGGREKSRTGGRSCRELSRRAEDDSGNGLSMEISRAGGVL
jgi:hypothetical protein